MRSLVMAASFTAALACLPSLPAMAGDYQPLIEAEAPRETLDRLMPTWLADHGVPSAAIARIEDGEIAWSAVWGEQSAGVPADADTLYNIASMTKPVTAQVVLSLASDGSVDLDEAMSPFWVDPDIADDPRHEQLTPRLALTHRTGFPNWRYQTDGVLTFRADPGTPGYSGEGYDYVGRYVEKKTGKGLEELAQAHVFGPMGIDDMAYTQKDWFAERMALPHLADGTEQSPSPRETWNGADDIFATIRAYATFMTGVMAGEGLTDEIRAERFVLPMSIMPPQDNCPFGPGNCPDRGGFALGWSVFEYGEETIVMQGGGDAGEKTLGFFVPETGDGLVIFTNSANGSKLIRDAVAAVHDNEKFVAFLDAQAR